MEFDKCASAWLLKRHVDTLATFIFYPVGSLVDQGIPFDTPDAQLKRNARQSTFELILQQNGLHDPTLDAIGRIVHELEIVSWETSRYQQSPATRSLDSLIRTIMNSTQSPDTCFILAMEMFDSVYADIAHESPETNNRSEGDK